MIYGMGHKGIHKGIHSVRGFEAAIRWRSAPICR